jgi:hypothetical protein
LYLSLVVLSLPVSVTIEQQNPPKQAGRLFNFSQIKIMKICVKFGKSCFVGSAPGREEGEPVDERDDDVLHVDHRVQLESI